MKRLNRTWIFSDTIKGHEVQSVALAQVISENHKVFPCSIRQPWRTFAPRNLWGFANNLAWLKEHPDSNVFPPDCLITCGRTMAAVGKYFSQKLNKPHIQILNPGDSLDNYTLVILPKHDNKEAENIISIRGSLHGFSPSTLAVLKQNHQHQFNQTKKQVAIFIGNPQIHFLKNELSQIMNQNPTEKAEMHLVASRRTSQQSRNYLSENYKDLFNLWMDEGDGENPYLGLLACADEFYVTADSINMVSEVCATKRPVYIISNNELPKKHQRFLQSIEKRYLVIGEPASNSDREPILNLNEIAEKVLNLLAND